MQSVVKSLKYIFLYFANCKLTHELGRKLPRFGSRTLSIDSEPIGGAVVLRLPCWYLAAADWKNCRPNRSHVKPDNIYCTHWGYHLTSTVVNLLKSVKCFSGNYSLFAGGAVASWLVRSTLDRAVRVRDLAGDIALCSWARHFTLTVPLSTQVYNRYRRI